MPKFVIVALLGVATLSCTAAQAQSDETALMGSASMSPQSLADTLLPMLGRAMGLPPRHKVVVTETDRSALRSMLMGVMRRQYPGASLTWMNQAYQAIGLVPLTADLRSAALALYEGQVAGYYDAYLHQMALVRGVSSMERAQVLQHELAHALQDQHFGLQALLDAVALDDDQAMALQSVIEGQAMVAMNVGMQEGLDALSAVSPDTATQPLTREALREQFQQAGMSMSDSELDTLLSGGAKDGQAAKQALAMAAAALPQPTAEPGQVPYLQAQLTFPYQEGTHFIETLLQSASFPEVIQRTLRHPPKSTRVILHPELYTSKSEVVSVTLPHVESLPGASRMYQTTVGELNVRTLLGGVTPGEALARALVGDHLIGLQVDASPLFAWVTVWQSPAAAINFVRFMHGLFAQRSTLLTDHVFVRQGRHDVIVSKGAHVGILAGLTAAQQSAAVTALMLDMARE